MNSSSSRIYHITTRHEWRAAQKAGEYLPLTFNVEGFIHCSLAIQVLPVVNALYAGRQNLILLEIDPARIGRDPP